MTTLLIDNHDSNTFNLFQLLAVVEGAEPVVVRNDEADWAPLRAERFDRCVISAGPGRPDRPRDFGLSRGALGAGRAAGARRLPRPPGPRARPRRRASARRRSRCTAAAAASTTTDSELFRGIPQGFLAVRYHSLVGARAAPRRARGRSPARRSGTVMALRHRERPHWGVQFHPESVQTEFGRAAARATSAALARSRRAGAPPPAGRPAAARAGAATAAGEQAAAARARGAHGAPPARSPRRAFVGLFGAEPNAFWLDSAATARGWRASRTWARAAVRCRPCSATTWPPPS